VFLRSVYGNAWKVTSSQVPENFPPSLGIHYIVMYTGVRRFDRIPSLKPLVPEAKLPKSNLLCKFRGAAAAPRNFRRKFQINKVYSETRGFQCPTRPFGAPRSATSGALDPTRLESLGSQRGAPMEHFESELFGTRVPGSVALPTK